jgi:DNA-binding CsgD family transcriptional regulator
LSTTYAGLNGLLDLLIQRPNANELLKALETNFLSKYKLSNAMIFSLDSHNTSKEIYSNNSSAESKNGHEFSLVLASLPPNSNLSSLTDSKIGKSVNNDFVITPISNGKSLSGFILLVLDCAGLSPKDLSQIETMGKVCAFYLINELPEFKSVIPINKIITQIQFSARQIQIINGFVEGKTNHELAEDLGFSVSTIRHETMDIFRLLGASDRKEAAKIAQERDFV